MSSVAVALKFNTKSKKKVEIISYLEIFMVYSIGSNFGLGDLKQVSPTNKNRVKLTPHDIAV